MAAPPQRFFHSSDKVFSLLFFLIAFASSAFGQNDNVSDWPKPKQNVFSFNGGINNGFVIVHTQAVAFTKGSRPLGIELGASWQRNDSETVDLCNCYPRKGVVVNYYHMGNANLGNIYDARFFLEPMYKVGRGVFFSFKAALGVAYGTNPYDSLHNAINYAYSTHLNAFLMLGAGLSFRLNKQLWLNPSLNFNHVSNGGMHLPNKGIDWPTAGLIIHYQEHPAIFYAGRRKKSWEWKNKGVRWDAAVMGIVTKVVDANKQARFSPLAGLEFLGSKQIGTLSAISVGTEVFTDPGHALQVQVENALRVSPVRAGFLFGHEFLLGKFIFSQRLGVYYFSQMPYDRVYHRWALTYRIDEHWGAGFSLLAHRQVANFFNAKAVYSWQKKKGSREK